MSELPLVFGVIALTAAVMIWLLFAFRKFLRAREQHLPSAEAAVAKTAGGATLARPTARPAAHIARRSQAA